MHTMTHSLVGLFSDIFVSQFVHFGLYISDVTRVCVRRIVMNPNKTATCDLGLFLNSNEELEIYDYEFLFFNFLDPVIGH